MSHGPLIRGMGPFVKSDVRDLPSIIQGPRAERSRGRRDEYARAAYGRENRRFYMLKEDSEVCSPRRT